MPPAFAATINGQRVTNLVIPTTLSEIKDNTFNGWVSLTNVTMSNNITKIGGNAFYDCSGMTTINISN